MYSDKTNTNTNTTPSAGETCSTEATQGPEATQPYLWRAVCVKIIALPIWIWIKFYPRPHRPACTPVVSKFTDSAIHVDMDKIGFIHIHTDEVRAVCVKITDREIYKILSMSTYASTRSSSVGSKLLGQEQDISTKTFRIDYSEPWDSEQQGGVEKKITPTTTSFFVAVELIFFSTSP